MKKSVMDSLNDDAIIQRQEKDVYSIVVDGETVIVNVQSGDQYSLNQTGTVIWQLADGAHTLRQIVASLEEQYDVTEEQAHSEVFQLASELLNESLIIVK